jgi:hypothetical protein
MDDLQIELAKEAPEYPRTPQGVATMYVIDKATGEKILIKAFRFNSEIHETLGNPPQMTVRSIETPYDSFKRFELMRMCKEKGIRTMLTMSRLELIKKLMEHDNSVTSQA